MEECHDHLRESHNLPERWIMVFWERGCSSAWTRPNGAGTNQLSQRGQTMQTQSNFTQELFYHRGTKASETDRNKTKLRFCIEDSKNKKFLQPLWKAKFGACSFHCRTLHHGHSRLREHWTWKPETPPNHDHIEAGTFIIAFPHICMGHATSHTSVQIKTETSFYPPTLDGVISVPKVFTMIFVSVTTKR